MIRERSKNTLILILSSTHGFYTEKHVSITLFINPNRCQHNVLVVFCPNLSPKIFFEETCINRIHLFKIMIILNE